MELEGADLPEGYDPNIVGEVGFPLGNSPEESVRNMLAHLKEELARIEGGPPPEHLGPSDLRLRAAIQEAVVIEQELRKGDGANPTVAQRANLLRSDVWSRWRAGEHGGSPEAPLGRAIEKLADVADRLAALSAPARGDTIHAPAGVVDRRHVSPADRNDPPVVELAPTADGGSTALLFSTAMEQYLKARADGGAERGALSTMRLRAGMFIKLMGDKPIADLRPKDLQDYVNLLQWVPLEYSRDGDDHEALQHMELPELIERNRKHRCWEPLSIKTMQDGYVQVVKTIVSEAVLNYPLKNPFAQLRLRWPKNAKPSVKREALDYEKLDNLFELGIASGHLDDAMIPPLAFLSTRRIGIIPWIRGCDFDRKHGVDIVRVNGIVFDKEHGMWRRVPYKTGASLRYFVLHRFFRDIGFVDWAVAQGDNFLFGLLQSVVDPSDTASKRINRLLLKGGAKGMNIEVGHSIRHGGKDLLIDEDVDEGATRLQMGHEPTDVHAKYGQRDELRPKQCQELANFTLPPEINWKRFEGLDLEAMARKPRKVGRPAKAGESG